MTCDFWFQLYFSIRRNTAGIPPEASGHRIGLYLLWQLFIPGITYDHKIYKTTFNKCRFVQAECDGLEHTIFSDKIFQNHTVFVVFIQTKFTLHPMPLVWHLICIPGSLSRHNKIFNLWPERDPNTMGLLGSCHI